MKKVWILLVLVFGFTAIHAQKGKRVTCWTALRNGELDIAQKAIDEAILHEKTIKDAKTWLYYGQTYRAISYTIKPEYKELDANPLTKSMKGYFSSLIFNLADSAHHSLSLYKDGDSEKYNTIIADKATKYNESDVNNIVLKEELPQLSYLFQLAASDAFSKNKDYLKALEHFESTLLISAVLGFADTSNVYNAALACRMGEQYEKAIVYYDKAIELKFGKTKDEQVDVYFQKALMYRKLDDMDNFQKTLEDGVAAFPNHSLELLKSLINVYGEKGESEKALEYLTLAIKNDQGNPNLYGVMGGTYEKLADKYMTNGNKEKAADYKQKAVDTYKRAIEVDETYFDAYLNLGVIYYNNAIDINNNASSINEDAKYKAEIIKRDEMFQNALPYLEKARGLEAKDVTVLQSLKSVYYRLKMMDKYDEVKAELDNL